MHADSPVDPRDHPSSGPVVSPADVLPLADILPKVVDAVTAAGQLVAAEFARPDGPRFSDHVTAPLDIEIELMLRDRLLALVPAHFVGEEAGILDAEESASGKGYCWLVDPHDGTRAFLEGRRGSAVSVALLHLGSPILAVVFAPTSPDRGPDLIYWARGGKIHRNGEPVTIDLRERELAPGDVVFLNHGAWQRPVWHGQACAPAGFMPLPSIAYRLARVAVGDGLATMTLRPVNALDIAAGHALLMAAGGVLLAEDGAPVTYDDLGRSRPSACFGGAPQAVAALRARTWRGSTEPRRTAQVTLNWPRVVPEAMLDRAAGCLFGLAIADDLGSETERAVMFARALLSGAGSETSRSNVETTRPDGKTAGPDGETTGPTAEMAGPDRTRAVPGGGTARSKRTLARAIPIGLAARDPEAAAEMARREIPGEIEAPALAAAVAAGIRGATPDEMRRLDPFFGSAPAWIAGALKGAVHGRTVFPVPQVMRVLTWRPDAGLGVANPRPDICWTDDLVDLAEALLSRAVTRG